MNKKIEKIVHDTFKLRGPIEESWTSENIEAWDSMGHLKLILGLESEFGVKFEIDELFQIISIADIEKILTSKKVNLDE